MLDDDIVVENFILCPRAEDACMMHQYGMYNNENCHDVIAQNIYRLCSHVSRNNNDLFTLLIYSTIY